MKITALVGGFLAGVGLLWVLASCAQQQPFMPLGAHVGPPMGAADFCKRNPQDARCQP